MIIPNLTMNSVYEIVVRGGTRSAIDNRLIIRGEGSAPQKVRGIRDCNRAPPLLPHTTIWFSSGVIAGMICACLAVMLIITSFVLWKWGSTVYFLSTSFILHVPSRLLSSSLLLSPFFFFFFLFFPFSSYSLNSFQFFAIRRRRKKKGWREKRECKIVPRPKPATQARDRSRPQARVHSFNFANAISLPPSHDNRHSFVIVQLQTIHDAVTQY